MVVLICIGLFFIVLSGLINAIQLRKFFQGLNTLNTLTKNGSTWDKILYPCRLICLTPHLTPLVPDILLMSLGGMVGLGGGITGFIVGIGGTCMVTLILKVAMKMAGRRL